MMNFEMAAVPYWPIRRRKLMRRRIAIVALLAIAVGSFVVVRNHLASETIGQRVFDDVTTTMAVRYYDRSYHGLNWSAIVDEYRPKVEHAGTEGQRYRFLREMLGRLGDSHTAIFSPSEVHSVQDQGEGALGATFVTLGHDRVVLRVAPRSPAARSGLRPGFIVAQRAGSESDSSTRWFAIRDPLSGKSWQRRIRLAQGNAYDSLAMPELDWGTAAPNVAYLRLASFPNGMEQALGWAVTDIGRHPALILDLRGNPGGLIDEVDATAGIFLPAGTLVVSGTGRYHLLGQRRFVATDAAQIHFNGRVAVLVDANSESGAEALTSALQIYRRAIVIGEPTARRVLGVEVEQRLVDGGLLRVATLDMRDANGNLLEGKGITPDIVVSRTAADIARGQDPQLRRAIAALIAPARP